jgi:hypothetical protein
MPRAPLRGRLPVRADRTGTSPVAYVGAQAGFAFLGWCRGYCTRTATRPTRTLASGPRCNARAEAVVVSGSQNMRVGLGARSTNALPVLHAGCLAALINRLGGGGRRNEFVIQSKIVVLDFRSHFGRARGQGLKGSILSAREGSPGAPGRVARVQRDNFFSEP